VESQLAVLVLLHAVKIDVEEVGRVERATLGFGMELGAEDGARLVNHTLVAGVVQVDEVWLPVRGQSGCIHGVTVVLAGDVAATSSQVESRDVVGTVTVLQLDGASASSQSKELVTQADTEDGDLRGLHQAAEVVGGVLAMGRVTGAVGDENTVKVVSDLVDGVVEGEDGNASTAADEAAQNVLLDSTIENSDVTLRVRCAHVEGRLGADLANKVNLFRIGESLILIGVVLLTNGDTSKGRTLLTEVRDDGTSVNARDGRHTLTGAPFAETLNGSPVRVLFSNVSHDDTSRLEVGRLEVLEKTVRVLLSRRNTVVTNQRLGENQDLTTIGGISQGFRVSNQRGGEDGLSGNVGAGTEGLSVEDRTISDRKSCSLKRPLRANSGHEARLEGAHGR
jgi:hypothetical protein